MQLTVTGATGNVGTAVLRALADEPEVDAVVGVARRIPGPSAGPAPAGLRWVAADVATDDLAPAMVGSDVVVHLAWLFQPTHDPVATWRTNVGGTERVLAAAVEAGVGTVVHASSVGAYSPGADQPAVDESWPTTALPTAAYGREKSYVERLLDVVEAQHPDLRVVRLRPAFTFQRTSAAEQRRLFAGPLLPGSLLAPGKVPVTPDVAGLRFQVVHADDVAQAYRLAVASDVRGPLNVATDPVVDTDLLAAVLGGRRVPLPRVVLRSAVAAGWHLRVLPASPGLLDLFLSLPTMDTTRIRTELGWTPTHDAEEALRTLLEGMHDDEGGRTPPLAAGRGGPLRIRELATGSRGAP